MAAIDGIQAYKMYEKTSKNGNVYYVGRIGGVKVVMMRSDREKGNNGEAVWNVIYTPAQPFKKEGTGYQPAAPKARSKPRPEPEDYERELDPDDPALAF